MDEAHLLQVQKLIAENPPKEFEGMQLEKAFTYPLLDFTSKSLIQELKVLFSPILKEHYQIAQKGTDGKIFLFGLSYSNRMDHLKKFENIVSLFSDSTEIIPKKGICFKNFLYIWKVPLWAKKYKPFFKTNGLYRYVAYLFFHSYCQLQEVKKFEKKIGKVNMFVSWCDVHLSDFIATQYFNHKGIPTATLQHAHFDIYDSIQKWAYINTPSKYFLCYGDYTAERAEKLGVPKEKLIPLGMPEQIGVQLPIEMKKSNTNIFGVSLSFITQKEENIALLQAADYLCNQYNLKCYIRPHPALDMKDYSEYIKRNMEIQSVQESMNQFIDKCDFVVLGTSDVYLTLISNLIPVFRYCQNQERDRFETMNWSTFNSVHQLIEYYELFLNNPQWMEKNLIVMRNKILAKGNPTENYFNFLSGFDN